MITYGPRFLIDDQIAIIRRNFDKIQKKIWDVVFKILYGAAKCCIMNLWCVCPPSPTLPLFPHCILQRHLRSSAGMRILIGLCWCLPRWFIFMYHSQMVLIFPPAAAADFLIHFKLKTENFHFPFLCPETLCDIYNITLICKYPEDKIKLQIQCVPRATEHCISLIILPPMKILQRNLNRSTLVVWEMKRNVFVVRFKFRCNILISGKIIKEMPGSVASWTSCIMNSKKKRYPYKAWRNNLAEQHWVFSTNRLHMLDSLSSSLPVIWTLILSKAVLNILPWISAFPYQNLSTIAPYSYFIRQESTLHSLSNWKRSRRTATVIINLGKRRPWVLSFTPDPFTATLRAGKESPASIQEAWWTPESVWPCRE